MKENPKIIVMKNNVPAHYSFCANEKRKEGVLKIDWPAFPHNLNLIEHIWNLIKGRILTRKQAARVTTRTVMVTALLEE